MTKADKILSYKDPASREITFCGERVAVTAPTSETTPELINSVRSLKGTEDEMKNMPVVDLVLPLMHCVPEIAIYCLRDPDTWEPIFMDDTPELRARLKRVPSPDAVKLLAACMELFNTKV